MDLCVSEIHKAEFRSIDSALTLTLNRDLFQAFKDLV